MERSKPSSLCKEDPTYPVFEIVWWWWSHQLLLAWLVEAWESRGPYTKSRGHAIARNGTIDQK